MAETDKENKTEQATPKRLEDARKKGQVAKSREVGSAFILAAALVYFYFGAAGVMNKMMVLMKTSLGGLSRDDLTVSSLQMLIGEMLVKTSAIVLPFLLCLMAAGVMANLLQVGVIFSTEPIQPKLSKISPLKGLQNLFSLRTLAELVKSLLKVAVVGLIAYLTIVAEAPQVVPLMRQDAWQIASFLGRVSFKIVFAACWVLILLAFLDYLYQHWEHGRSLRMSRQDVKDEYKTTEGDPLVKARIRKLQRETAMRRMMSKVPTADVVITNPTHLAVALKYDDSKMAAPVVVAKGADLIAQRIKEIARQKGVAVVENKTLAQVLYRIVDIGEVIPENLYQAVAEVLAYVYRLRGGRPVH